MKPRRPDATTYALDDALSANAPWNGLVQRLRASQQRLEAVAEVLPPALAGQLRPGPLDDGTWTLLVPSGGAASKLRQCIPLIEQRMQERGWPVVSIRVKVGSRSR